MSCAVQGMAKKRGHNPYPCGAYDLVGGTDMNQSPKNRTKAATVRETQMSDRPGRLL